MGWVSRQVDDPDGRTRYRVFLPARWKSRPVWPVILYLHGAGERGDDGLSPTRVGLGPRIRAGTQDFPGVVVFPQCAVDRYWTSHAMQSRADRILERTIEEFHGDPARLYLTGISMGGYGTVAMALRHPQRFAALVPICGGISRRMKDASKRDWQGLRRVPVWVFHGDADDTIPVAESRRLVAALRDAGNALVRYTEYPGVRHNSWDPAYADPDLWPWLFAQSRCAGATRSRSESPPG